MVIGSLSAIVAVAALAPFFSEICDDTVEVMAPSVTVKDSAVSESASSVAVMVIVWVAPAAEFAAKVTVPEVSSRSALSAASVPSGALHATRTSLATAAERVTVKEASDPSATFDAGPLMLSSAVSLSLGSSVVVLSSSVSVIGGRGDAEAGHRGRAGDDVIVSSPSTTWSSVGVMVSVPSPLVELAGMVIVASDVAV